MKEKGKGIPGELPASTAVRDSLVGGQESFRASPEHPPGGTGPAKSSAMHFRRVDGGVLRTPEFKVKFLWN